MKNIVISAVVVAALAGTGYSLGWFGGAPDTAPAQPGQGAVPDAGGPPGGRAGGGRGGRGGFGGRGQLTVDVAPVVRAAVNQELSVVGTLVGDVNVSVVPKTAGRLQELRVRLGDRLTMGQRIAKIEDQELQEQVKQAEAAAEVAKATIRQREADLALAKTNVDRSRNLFQRQLLPQQSLDDNEARYQSAIAALDLARAQNQQSSARLEELRITLENTVIVSPVNGFVARRAVDPGAFVGPNAPIVDVVDITRVRMVANVVEKDLRQVGVGDLARVEVDAFPGENFMGRIARVAPTLDPSTRTAPIEIEIPNGDYRLKPGMYARVGVVIEQHKDAIIVPTNAVVDVNGSRGVYVNANGVAQFHPVKTGIEGNERIEILDGVSVGDMVVTTGASALRNGDPVILAGRGGRGGGRGGRGGPNGNGPTGANGPGAGAAGPGGPAGTDAGRGTPGGDSAPDGVRGGRRGGGDPGRAGRLGGGARPEGAAPDGGPRRGGFGGGRRGQPGTGPAASPETR